MKRLVSELREQQAEGARLDAAIGQNLKALGFWEGTLSAGAGESSGAGGVSDPSD